MGARRVVRASARVVTTAAVLGTGVLAYSLLEARHPVLRRHDVPVLAPGEPPLTVLHLSDLHLTSRTEHLVTWVRGLVGLRPDIVVNTGDNLSLVSGLEPLARALEPLLEVPGAFVMGDHDYRSTTFRLPTRYLRRDPRTADRPDSGPEALPWEEIRDLQSSGGWVDLTNRRGTLSVRGRTVELVGVDDPHVYRDAFPLPATRSGAGRGASASPSAAAGSTSRTAPAEPAGPAVLRDAGGRALRLGLLHAPYRRVLDAMVADGAALALAGHTHGGQLCVPGYGALVTNCDLDRGRASGLSWWPGTSPPASQCRAPSPGAAPAVSTGWAGGTEQDVAAPSPSAAPGPPGASTPGMYLHVSAGLGTSPYTPVRLACPPQATLLRLVPAR